MNRHTLWFASAAAISFLSADAEADIGYAKVQVSAGTVAVSPADPATAFRARRSLSVSRDAGHTWTRVGPLPGTVNDLAASRRDPDTVYAATGAGLLVSRDAGRSWTGLVGGNPATIVEVTDEGFIYAYVIKRGLVRSAEEPLRFSEYDADGLLFYVAVDQSGTQRFVRDER